MTDTITTDPNDGNLPQAILSHLCSFCDAALLLQLLAASYRTFKAPVRWSLRTSSSLHLSFLQKLHQRSPSTLRTLTTTSHDINGNSNGNRGVVTTWGRNNQVKSSSLHQPQVHEQEGCHQEVQLASRVSRRRRLSATTSIGAETTTSSTSTTSTVAASRRDQIQEDAVARLLGMLVADDEERKYSLRHLDLSSLRYVTGRKWMTQHLSRLAKNLVTLDFSGCSKLDTTLLRSVLVGPTTVSQAVSVANGAEVAPGSSRSLPRSSQQQEEVRSRSETRMTNPKHLAALRHLNLQGCRTVEATTVRVIASTLYELDSLLIGGCSQTIRDDCILLIMDNLRNLQHLDFSGLRHITDQNGTLFDKLPSKLISLKLSHCEKVRLSGSEHRHWMTYDIAARHVMLDRGTSEMAWARQVEGRRVLPMQPLPLSTARRSILDGEAHPSSRNQPILQQQQHLRTVPRHKEITKIDFDCIGTPRRCLVNGALAYFAVSSNALREVNISGCVRFDWEIEILAVACAESLTSLEMRACGIGDLAIHALARNCTKLAEIDISGCSDISDDGVMALTRDFTGQTMQPNLVGATSSGAATIGIVEQHDIVASVAALGGVERRGLPKTLRVLRAKELPLLTDQAVRSISVLQSLQLLDVFNCQRINSQTLANTVIALPKLIEVDARGIAENGKDFTSILRNRLDENGLMGQRLRFVNNRLFQWRISHKRKASGRQPCCEGLGEEGSSLELSAAPRQHESTPQRCCTIRRHSQRTRPSQGVPLQPMFHCRDCGLLSSMGLGVCSTCASTCHKEHDTFLGSYTRSYCDCAYGTSLNTKCKAVFPPTLLK